MARWCWLLLLFHALTGCALFRGGDAKLVPPAELVRLQETVKLKARWQARVGGDDDRILNLVPAYDDGRIYVSDYKGRVRALDAASGKQIWKTDSGVAVSGGPGVGDGVVLLGTGDGDVVALDAETGNKIWGAPVTSEVLSIPRAAFGIAGIQTSSGDLIGLSLQDGQRQWIYDRSVPTLTLRGTGSPALFNGRIVGGFASGKVSAIDIGSGRMIWEVSVAVPRGRSELERLVDIDASPKIRDGIVYTVSFQGKLAALELETGRMLWNRDMSSFAGLGVDDGRIYVTNEQSNVLGLDRRNGTSLWEQDGLHGRVLTAPVPFNDFVAVGDFEGYLHLLSRGDGQLAGRVRVDRSGISAAPVATDDTLYVLGRGGVLAAYELQQVKANKQKQQPDQ